MKLLGVLEVFAHPAHALGERPDRLEHLGLLEVAENPVAIAHRRGIVQRRVEEWR